MSEGGGFIAGSGTASSPSDPSRAEANRLRALQLLEEKRRAAGQTGQPGPSNGDNGHNGGSSNGGPSNAGPSGGPEPQAGQAPPGGSGASVPPPRRGQKRDYLNYYEYNLSEIRDTRGGFMAIEDDEAQVQGREGRGKPIEKRLRTDPQIVLPLTENPKCRHCTSLTVDQALQEHFKINVCRECRDARPDQYSLLTKTECKEDYLLTESELRDPEALPHWLRPNPHKTTWSNMMLYLREQVEEFAWKKWGSAEALDAEFERREKEKRDKKEKKHKEKMAELRRKTRTSSWVKKEEKHVHKWVVEEDDGSGAKIEICKECGLTIEVEDF